MIYLWKIDKTTLEVISVLDDKRYEIERYRDRMQEEDREIYVYLAGRIAPLHIDLIKGFDKKLQMELCPECLL